MKERIKRWRRPALFILGGALAGLAWHYLEGCSGNTCTIAASPVNSMLYMAVIGWLLSVALAPGCRGNCRR